MSSRGRVEPERRDVDPRAVLLAGTALAGLIIATLAALGLIYGVPPRPLPFGSATGLVGRDGPILQTDPHADLKAYAADKDRALHGYGWIDKQAGIAHVPIEKAMEAIARDGIPDWGERARPAEGACALLAANVPRAPQNERCRPAAGETP